MTARNSIQRNNETGIWARISGRLMRCSALRLCVIVMLTGLALITGGQAQASGSVGPTSTSTFVTFLNPYADGHGGTYEASCLDFFNKNGFAADSSYAVEVHESFCVVNNAYSGNMYRHAYTSGSTTASCPAHSSETPSPCTCDAGYVPDETARACIAGAPPPPPPPAPPPMGCATGAGGFMSCPGNSPPSGKPDGPGQNNGNPNGSPGPNPSGPADGSGSKSSDGLPGADAGNGSAKQCRKSDVFGDPILASTGNVFQREVDYVSPIGLSLARSYNSSQATWVHSYMLRIIANADTADVVRPDGKILTFTGNGAGVWTSNNTVVEQLIKLEAGGAAAWKFINADDAVELYNASGMPLSVTARSGRSLAFTSNGIQLQSVTDNWGHALTFAYDAQSRVTSITTPDARSIAYSYDAQGRLAVVTYPDARTRQYLGATHAADRPHRRERQAAGVVGV
jgi:YD repeat-containing protein